MLAALPHRFTRWTTAHKFSQCILYVHPNTFEARLVFSCSGINLCKSDAMDFGNLKVLMAGNLPGVSLLGVLLSKKFKELLGEREEP